MGKSVDIFHLLDRIQPVIAFRRTCHCRLLVHISVQYSSCSHDTRTTWKNGNSDEVFTNFSSQVRFSCSWWPGEDFSKGDICQMVDEFAKVSVSCNRLSLETVTQYMICYVIEYHFQSGLSKLTSEPTAHTKFAKYGDSAFNVLSWYCVIQRDRLTFFKQLISCSLW